MSARAYACSRCGCAGHNARTCPQAGGAGVGGAPVPSPSPIAAPRPTPQPVSPAQDRRPARARPEAPPPVDLEAFRVEWEAFLDGAPDTRKRIRRLAYDLAPPGVRRAVEHLLAGHVTDEAARSFRAGRSTLDAKLAEDQRLRPFEHTLREGNGIGDAYIPGASPAFRWRHTWTHRTTGDRIVATLPVPPSGDAFEDGCGLVALRFLPAEGAAALVAHLWPSARVEVIAAGATATAAPGATTVVTRGESCLVASMTYGEGMF